MKTVNRWKVSYFTPESIKSMTIYPHEKRKQDEVTEGISQRPNNINRQHEKFDTIEEALERKRELQLEEGVNMIRVERIRERVNQDD